MGQIYIHLCLGTTQLLIAKDFFFSCFLNKPRAQSCLISLNPRNNRLLQHLTMNAPHMPAL